MFAVIILFQVKQGREASFLEAWKSLTEVIYLKEGSLGSRLHKTESLTYLAYAQWPDRKTWVDSNKITGSAIELRKQLRECCNGIEVTYELEVVDDLLKKEAI